MEDLNLRARKYAISAGEIQLGHYKAARQSEVLSQWLSWTATVLSAVVGTSIFTQWVSAYPVPFGLAAMTASALAAIQRSSKLNERSEAHRIAGANYGELRRRIDMLRLRLAAGDLNRTQALPELDETGKALSNLAKESRALPDRIYYPACERFKKDHPRYFESGPTHAGGVVIRHLDSAVQFLIVTASDTPNNWVLPKGHIESGESAEQAARREVLEETGIVTSIRENLGCEDILAPSGKITAVFFLMEAVGQRQPRESRRLQWLHYEEALKQLTFKEAQCLLVQANLLLEELAASRAPLDRGEKK